MQPSAGVPDALPPSGSDLWRAFRRCDAAFKHPHVDFNRWEATPSSNIGVGSDRDQPIARSSYSVCLHSAGGDSRRRDSWSDPGWSELFDGNPPKRDAVVQTDIAASDLASMQDMCDNWERNYRRGGRKGTFGL